METYNYDDPNVAPNFTQEGSVIPSVPDNGTAGDVPTPSGFSPETSVTPTFTDNNSGLSPTPVFGPASSVNPSYSSGTSAITPSFSSGTSAITPSFSSGTSSVTPSLSFGASSVTPAFSTGSGLRCINCSGPAVWPNSQSGILWTWGTLSPFFSTTSDIAHVRFYNAAAIREPLDIYLNGRLLVSNLDYMNYTRYLHIIPGIYRLTIYRRSTPGIAIIDTGVQFRGGNSYTVTVLGIANSYSVQVMTS